MIPFKNSRIYIAGHSGLVGSALLRVLSGKGYDCLITAGFEELNLMETSSVDAFFAKNRPDIVILTAARVGSIRESRDEPFSFLHDNLMIQNNVFKACGENGVKKVLYFASSNMYPESALQPIGEDQVFTGQLEVTREGYALSKLVGSRMCELVYRQYGMEAVSLVPCNIYGPGDKFDPEHSHVIASLIRKFHEAKMNNEESVSVWGTGNVKKEFLFVEDVAEACVHLMETCEGYGVYNVGCGQEITIRDLAYMIRDVVGYEGEVVFDSCKPEGVMSHLLDSSALQATGWKASVELRDGIRKTYQWFLENITMESSTGRQAVWRK